MQVSDAAPTGLHAFPQPPQLLVDVVEVAHPPRSGLSPVVQSAKPASHVYEHCVPLQVVGLEFAVGQTFPQPPQSDVDDRDVSHPLVSGAVVSQSAYPGSHPVYVQPPPVHAAPLLRLVSQAAPQAPQFVTVSICVSQPLVSGGVVTQSA